MIKPEEFSENYTLTRGTLLGTKPNDLNRVFLNHHKNNLLRQK